MAYTLRGRIESRLPAALLALVVTPILTGALHRWWPVELAGLMLGVGLAFDLVYDRVLDYQPGWAALPLGLLELAAVMGLVRALDVHAPLAPALGLFAGAWLAGQVLGHAGYPLLRLSYGDDGGELGRGGPAVAAVVLLLFAGAAGAARATHPPTVHLAAGVHRGPIVIDRAETLTGPADAVVLGGIVVRASQVHIHGLTVVGGDYGIDIDGARDVTVRGTTVRGARLDGIHVRRSSVTLKDCRVESGENPWAQGIDISYTFHLMSLVERCVVTGGQEGIVTHSAMAMLRDNRVLGTSLRGISMTEMSMGAVERNSVHGAVGVGILCGDHSTCEIQRNHVSGTRDDSADGDRSRAGYGLVVQFGAIAELERNRFGANPLQVGVFSDAWIRPSG